MQTRTSQIIVSQIKVIKDEHYQPPQSTNCSVHHIPKDSICLQEKCQFYNHLVCVDCSLCKHPLINYKKIVPMLSQWLLREQSQIQGRNSEIQKEWNISVTNLKYCIELFQQLIRIIQDQKQNRRSNNHNFVSITNSVYGMFTKNHVNSTPQLLVKSFASLNHKYQLINLSSSNSLDSKGKQTQNHLKIQCEKLNFQKQQRFTNSKNASLKTKKFSQKCLVFSQALTGLVQDKIKEEKRREKLHLLKQKNSICLKDLLTKKQQIHSSLSTIQDLTIEFPKQQRQAELISHQISSIQKFSNLRCLKVNNKNGKIDHKVWINITNHIEMLSFLKQLKLINLNRKDLKSLTNLFEKKQKAVRQIQILTLQINDETQPDLLSLVNEFINTLQLRSLSLILTRDNLNRKQIVQFIKKMKVYTSLSQLPLLQCNLTLTANKLHEDQKNQIQLVFNTKCKDVKLKKIIL